jgi:hypothetical protein
MMIELKQFRNKSRLYLLSRINASARWLEFYVNGADEERRSYWKAVLQFWEGKYYNEMKCWGDDTIMEQRN